MNSVQSSLAAASTSFSSNALDGLNLLLVEGDTDCRDAIALNLGRYRCKLDVVPELPQPQAERVNGRYDIVLLDMDLLDNSGSSTRTYLAEFGTGLIVFSFSLDRLQMVEALECGADDFILKPFHPQELKARIVALARRLSKDNAGKLAPGILTFDKFSLDRDQLALLHPEGRVEGFSVTEFEMLWSLATSRSAVRSRSQLLDHIYGRYAEVSDRIIDYHICKIRRKLSEVGVSLCIKTRRGIGYSLEVSGAK